jgi:hypothetical protein
MIKIVVTSPEIREMKGTGKTSGKPYHLRIQTCHAFTVDPDGVQSEFPDKFELMLEDGQAPFARGQYLLAPSSLSVRDGRLECRPRLVAAPVAQKG